MKHPLALATHPGLLRRDGQDGSTELEALPATCRQTNSRTALREEGAQGLIFASPLRSAPGTPCHPVRASNGLSESCPKTQTYRSLRLPSVAALVPSAGAITTANRVASVRMLLSTPHRDVSARCAARVPCHRRRRKSWKFVQSCTNPRSRVSCKARPRALS